MCHSSRCRDSWTTASLDIVGDWRGCGCEFCHWLGLRLRMSCSYQTCRSIKTRLIRPLFGRRSRHNVGCWWRWWFLGWRSWRCSSRRWTRWRENGVWRRCRWGGRVGITTFAATRFGIKCLSGDSYRHHTIWSCGSCCFTSGSRCRWRQRRHGCHGGVCWWSGRKQRGRRDRKLMLGRSDIGILQESTLQWGDPPASG